jgi:hypothetical protein
MAPTNRRHFFGVPCRVDDLEFEATVKVHGTRILESSKHVWPRRGGTAGGATGSRPHGFYLCGITSVGMAIELAVFGCGCAWVRQREETCQPERPATRIRDFSERVQAGRAEPKAKKA